MKFIREKLNIDYIIRRIRDEDSRNDRKVTEVRLNNDEWCEFLQNAPMRSTYASPAGYLDKFEVAISEPVSVGSGYCGPRRVVICRG